MAEPDTTQSASLPGAPSAPAASWFGPLLDPTGGPAMQRWRSFSAQDGVRRMLPWFAGMAGLGLLALVWQVMTPEPQRMLYSQLNDGERAGVVAALDQAAITYAIDNGTGALSVAEKDLYRARMVVASNGALATPETGAQMLDSLPLGASRTLEGDRLRAARERDLTLTIMEIDGVEAVRVHLAEAEKSVFVRDNAPPRASVMLRLARGRQLGHDQVTAIANLVAGSVPNLPVEAVRIVDQHGRLLSDRSSGGSNDGLEMQARMEEKLRQQLSRLLAPMLGEGNFSTEIQVELDLAEVTSARESYDKEGAVVRRENESLSRVLTPGPASGVPGVTSNTPPPPAIVEERPPLATGDQPATDAQPVTDQSSASRTYEMGREVAVSSTMPGTIRRLSVAVALSQSAMKQAKPAEITRIKELVSAAVGANSARGDEVAVMVRAFEPAQMAAPPFYETPWFASLLRIAGGVVVALLALLIVVRPLMAGLRRNHEGNTLAASGSAQMLADHTAPDGTLLPTPPQQMANSPESLNQQIGYLHQLVDARPERAVIAIREMLDDKVAENGAQPAATEGAQG